MTLVHELCIADDMCAYHARMADHYKCRVTNDVLFRWHFQQLDEWDCKRQTLRWAQAQAIALGTSTSHC
jgi:hypothetical protein